MFLFLYFSLSKITSDISVDQKSLSLVGENEELTQSIFRSFANVNILVSLTLEGFNILKSSAISDFSKLKSVTFLGNKLTKLEDSCFGGCTSLESIELPNGVQSIGYGCFRSCTSLENFTFPSTMTSFPSKGFEFYSCTSLKRFIVKEGNPVLSTNTEGSILIANDYTALFCVSNETITIPASITEISDYFINQLNVKYIIYEEGSNLAKVGNYAFRSTKIKTMIFPPKLKIIGTGPFDFTYIETLFLPASLEEVSSNIFVGQPLKNLTIEDGIKALKVESNGAVFNKDYSTLMYINPDADSLEIKQATNEIPSGLIQGVSKLVKLTVEENHPTFYDLNNILYNSTGLITAPGGIEHAALDSRCTKILDYAFDGCTKLKTIDFNGSAITHIGTGSFGTSNSLTNFVAQSSFVSIGAYCFSASNLNETKLIFGPNLISVYAYAFNSCKVIEANFSSCKNLLQISSYAFHNCQRLSKLILPPSCNALAENSFQGCKSLTSVTIPESVTNIYGYSFANCNSLSELNIEGNNLKIIYISAFMNCNILRVAIPDSVTEIQTNAFANNNNLETVTFSTNSKLTTLFPSVFDGCSKISEIYLGDYVSTISTGALGNMLGLTDIKVSINNKDFSSVKGVLHTKNGKKLIMCPGGITSLNVSEIVEEFEKSAFLGCSNLISIKMKEDQNIVRIPEQTFYGCTSLNSISIPQAVKIVAAEAFQGCISLKSVIFKEGSALDTLGSSAFNGCNLLEQIIFEEGSLLRAIEEGAFEGCKSLSVFTFGEKIESIGARAFKGCPLKNIIFNSNIMSIGEYCFEGSQAISIILPPTTKSIGSMCFTNSPNLKQILYCGDNSLDNVLVMSMKEIQSGLVRFYVKPSYSFDTAGGFPPMSVLDAECHIPSVQFTINNVGSVQPAAFMLSSVLCANTESEENEGRL